MLRNIRRIYLEKRKYMQSIPQFFIITVATYPKGKLSTKDSDQILSLPIDIYLYILAAMLFPHDTFLYDMHTRRYHFCTAIKICFLWATDIFCWLTRTLIEKRLNQTGVHLGISRFAPLASLTNFYPIVFPQNKIARVHVCLCIFISLSGSK